MLRKFHEREDEGFTLIELLVVVIIIGILAAIAIPVFLNQREKARNASANSDLRNLVTAEEAYYTDEDTYTDFVGTAADGGLRANGFTSSTDVFVCITFGTDTYRAATYHPDGTNYYYYDSSLGQIEKIDNDGTSVAEVDDILTDASKAACEQPNPAV